jgi:NAD(P)-dependent dehydrogenase (short-subunit alcohol dehydrogenase family)
MEISSQNPFCLQGKRILVTGASSGIGRTCAIELSKLGAQIVLLARNRERLEGTQNLMSGNGHLIETLDLTCSDEIVPRMKALAATSGPLDGLIHSAGISTTLPIRATDSEAFRRIISINLESAFFLCKAFRQKEVRSQTGSIVLIGSVMSVVGQPGLSAYCASKGALVTMAKALALELAREKIRVNVLAPGHVQTPMVDTVEKRLPEEAMGVIRANHPLGVGRPEDVAFAAAYLLSSAAAWVTGTTLVVDGGYTAA